jgi:hypothetical protein
MRCEIKKSKALTKSFICLAVKIVEKSMPAAYRRHDIAGRAAAYSLKCTA